MRRKKPLAVKFPPGLTTEFARAAFCAFFILRSLPTIHFAAGKVRQRRSNIMEEIVKVL